MRKYGNHTYINKNRRPVKKYKAGGQTEGFDRLSDNCPECHCMNAAGDCYWDNDCCVGGGGGMGPGPGLSPGMGPVPKPPPAPSAPQGPPKPKSSGWDGKYSSTPTYHMGGGIPGAPGLPSHSHNCSMYGDANSCEGGQNYSGGSIGGYGYCTWCGSYCTESYEGCTQSLPSPPAIGVTRRKRRRGFRTGGSPRKNINRLRIANCTNHQQCQGQCSGCNPCLCEYGECVCGSAPPGGGPGRKGGTAGSISSRANKSTTRDKIGKTRCPNGLPLPEGGVCPQN